MKFNVQWFDASTHVGSGEQPAAIVKIARPFKEFWVAQSQAFDDEGVWSIVVSGDYLRVPVFAYKTAQPTLETVFGVGVEIGVSLMRQLDERADRISEAVLVLGKTCDDMRPEEEAYRTFVGAAFKLK